MDEKIRSEKINTVAGEVLALSCNTLLVKLRFMDLALNALRLCPADGTTIATDGAAFYYSPRYVLKRYTDGHGAISADYLHSVFHCVFRHMYLHTLVDPSLWNLACDISVEYTVAGLGLRPDNTPEAYRNARIFRQLKAAGVEPTAEKLYRHFRDTGLTNEALAEYSAAFRADDHEIWYMLPEEKQKALGTKDTENEASPEEDLFSSIPAEAEFKETNDSSCEKRWQEIAERIQMDMESFSKARGSGAGGLIQNLREVNRERYDYTAFLKKFAVLGEAMKINDDEFDYIYYTYGMELYDDMPLVEPLEYKEIKGIQEFIIAIDTSASTSGELVRKFVEKTYNILQSTGSFFKKINLHVIQCDDVIQSDFKITRREEFDEYLKTMQIRGLGGTDFRPVFNYAETLREQGEFSNLKGLIYFTDGFGVFPKKKPGFETAFVFIDDSYRNPEVPPWAIKLVLQRDEI